MLEALLTVADCLLHLCSHSRPPEPVMQQAHSLLLTLVSSILVTSIHGSYLMSCRDYELQNIFQLTSWCVAMVEGSVVECQLLPPPKDSFPSSVFVSYPSRCFRSCTFQLEINLITVLSIGSSCWAVTQSVTCRFICAWVALARIAVSQTCLCISSSASPLLDHELLLFLSFPW